MSDALEKLGGDTQKARVCGIPELKNIQMVSRQVNALTQECHVDGCAMPTHELASRSGTQVCLLFEFWRKKPIEGFCSQRLVEQELSDGPIFEPIRPLVRGVIQYREARVQILRFRVMI